MDAKQQLIRSGYNVFPSPGSMKNYRAGILAQGDTEFTVQGLLPDPAAVREAAHGLLLLSQ